MNLSALISVALIYCAHAKSILGPGPITGCALDQEEAENNPDGGDVAAEFVNFKPTNLKQSTGDLIQPAALVMPVELDSITKQAMEAAKRSDEVTMEAVEADAVNKPTVVTKEAEKAAKDAIRPAEVTKEDEAAKRPVEVTMEDVEAEAVNKPTVVPKENDAVNRPSVVTKEDEEAAEDAIRDTRQLLDDLDLDMPPRPRPMLRRRRPHRRGPQRFHSPWLYGYNGQI